MILYADIPQTALPPCHLLCQFYVHLTQSDSPLGTKPKLSGPKQRSAGLGLGISFNIASYVLLAHLIDTEPHELIIQLVDAHAYRDHIDALKVQLEREPKEFPKLRWKWGRL